MTLQRELPATVSPRSLPTRPRFLAFDFPDNVLQMPHLGVQ